MNSQAKHVPGQRLVLVAGNDPEMLGILGEYLTHSSIAIQLAQTAAQTLLKAEAFKPDLLVIDRDLTDMDIAELCRKLSTVPQTPHVPIVLVGGQEADIGINGIGYVVVKPYEIKQVLDTVRLALKRIDRAENVDHQTGLVNEPLLAAEISDLIRQQIPFATIYIRLDDLRVFNSEFGYSQGDRVIRIASDVLRVSVQLLGGANDIVAHLGGGNFVVVTAVDLAAAVCHSVIKDFDSRMETVTTDRGDNLNKARIYPIALHAAVVIADSHRSWHYSDLSQIASQQMNVLREYPFSCSSLDLPQLDMTIGSGAEFREQNRLNLQLVSKARMAWSMLLSREIQTSLATIRLWLPKVIAEQTKSKINNRHDPHEELKKYIDRLSGLADELEHITHSFSIEDDLVLGQADIKESIARSTDRLRSFFVDRQIDVAVDCHDNAEGLIIDTGILGQALFYTLRSVLSCSNAGDSLKIDVRDSGNGYLSLEIMNMGSIITFQTLASKLQGELLGGDFRGTSGDLWTANVLLRLIGGSVTVENRENKGTCAIVSIPKKWSSEREDVASLLSSAETIGDEARASFDAIYSLIKATGVNERYTQAELSCEHLRSKLQELLVLCNRSLFLADDLSKRLEIQRDDSIGQELEHLRIADLILSACHGVATSMDAVHLFDPDVAHIAAEIAAGIAIELNLPRPRRQTIYVATLLQDLVSIIPPSKIVGWYANEPVDKEVALIVRFAPLWKALRKIDFLAPVLSLIQSRCTYAKPRLHPARNPGLTLSLDESVIEIARNYTLKMTEIPSYSDLDTESIEHKIAAESGLQLHAAAMSAFVQLLKNGRLALPERR